MSEKKFITPEQEKSEDVLADRYIKYMAAGIGLVMAMIAIAGNSVPAALVCIAASVFYHR